VLIVGLPLLKTLRQGCGEKRVIDTVIYTSRRKPLMSKKIIVTGDFHLRLSVPRCRTQTEQEWLAHQRSVIDSIVSMANLEDADLYINGDIFDKPIAHPSVVHMVVEALGFIRNTVYIGYGNHDLAVRSKDVSITSYGILDKMCDNVKWIKRIQNKQAWVPFGEENPIGRGDVLFLHELTVEKMEDAKFFEARSAKELLRTYPDYKFIVTSDNHKSFAVTYQDRVLLNPGCITKQNASYKDVKLLVYLIDLNTNSWEPIYLPEDNDVVDDSYLTQEHERDERLSAFVESLKAGGELSLSFRDNVKTALTNVKKGATINMIKELMEVTVGRQ
jgi:hypothetical protein